MKKASCLACLLLLLLTVFSISSASAMQTDFPGDWVCQYVDLGDGVLQSEYEGQALQEMLFFTLREDSSVSLSSFGVEQEGSWMPTGAGIAIIVDDLAVPFSYTDGQLVNMEDGVTMFFVRADSLTKQGGFSSLLNLGKTEETPAFDFAGDWDSVTYETGGASYDIAMFFPDGLTLTLSPDGAGYAQITPDYREAFTWSVMDGQITVDGSYMLFDPVWDAETQMLSLSYASELVRINFAKVSSQAAEVATDTPSDSGMLPQVYECAFFTAAFPETWEQDEYNTYDWEEYYSVQYNLTDESGWSLGSVRIVASVEDVVNYRNALDTLREYAREAGTDTLDETVIDGKTFLGTTYGDYWLYTEYQARVPEASITLIITVSSPDEIADVLPAILSSIHFTYPVPDPPLSDPPLPEDGAAYIPSPSTVTVGDYELSAVWLASDTPILPRDIYNGSIAVIDDTVYVLGGTKLYPLTRSGDTLSGAGSPVKLNDDYRMLSATWDGTLYITDGYYQGIIMKDGASEDIEIDGYLAMSPDGQWGLYYWSSSDVRKITVTDDGLATKTWILKDLSDDALRQGRFSAVDYIQITPDHIFVAGTDATADSATRIVMYDYDGNELAEFGSADWKDDSAISNVTGLVETNNGIIVQDGFYENYLLFALDGTFIGYTKSDDLLGTDSPWPIAMTPSDNGALVLLTQEREDGSATEMLVFEITGF